MQINGSLQVNLSNKKRALDVRVEGAFDVLSISAVVSVLIADDGNVAVKV